MSRNSSLVVFNLTISILQLSYDTDPNNISEYIISALYNVYRNTLLISPAHYAIYGVLSCQLCWELGHLALTFKSLCQCRLSLVSCIIWFGVVRCLSCNIEPLLDFNIQMNHDETF